jgi:uncharacterized protein (TIGR02265 family)
MTGLAETPPNESTSLREARRWVVFDHTVEGLFLVSLRGRLSVPAESSLRRAGVDLSEKLLPAYPVEIWRRCVEIAATVL